MQRKEYKVMLAVTFLNILIIPICICIGAFLLPAQYNNTFLGELKYKYERLEETKGKRIILVGGSSVAFGVDSKLLGESFPKYTVVNFGMYAGLGSEVMLDLSEKKIRKGDIVIFSPEQNKQTLSNYFNAQNMWQAVDGDFSLLSNIDKEDMKQMIGRLPYFSADKWNYFYKNRTPYITGVYSRKSFDAYGDIVSDCKANIMTDGYDKNTPIRLDKSVLDKKFVASVNTYIDHLNAKGATVWYHFCPMNERAVQKEDDVDAYYSFLQKQLHCYIIGNPNNSIFDAGWFYDTNFHLNSKGKQVNTRQMIRDIKAMLGDTSVTNITIPKEPQLETESEKANEISGDNRDAAYFTYKQADGRMTLCGLTKSGQKKNNLIVPVSYKGKQIKSLESNIFAGNDKIQTITIQENILSISDGAFKDCSHLKYIYVKNKQPQNCMVGQHLLNGTKADIIVDSSVLSAYRLSYFWSGYADRIASK